MRIISFSPLRGNLKKYLAEVARGSQTIMVYRSSKEDSVVIMSLKKYNSLTETGHLLLTSANRRRLMESLAQLSDGKTLTFTP